MSQKYTKTLTLSGSYSWLLNVWLQSSELKSFATQDAPHVFSAFCLQNTLSSGPYHVQQNKDTNIFSCLPPDSLSPTRLTACPQVPASSEFSRTYSASNSSVGRKSRYALITHHLLLHPSGHLLVGRVSMVHTSQRNCYLEPDSRSNANPSILSVSFSTAVISSFTSNTPVIQGSGPFSAYSPNNVAIPMSSWLGWDTLTMTSQ